MRTTLSCEKKSAPECSSSAKGPCDRAFALRERESSHVSRPNTWAIVLAAGDGTRLQQLTTERGVSRPKQYCSLRGGRSLLQTALARAGHVVPPERTLVVVAAQHQRFWSADLAGFPARNIVVQPRNRGTSAGILLPLVEVLARDAEARLVLLPSDHEVAEESVIASSMRRVLAALASPHPGVTLLGISPDGPESDYGWIVPAALGDRRVARFVEKPEPVLARKLLAHGAVWNSFLLAATGASLLELIERRLPALVARFREAFASPTDLAARMEELYAALPASDFSRDVLQGSEEHLRLEVVPPCGWTDLGTPDRVIACLASGGAEVSHASPGYPTNLDLSRALERLRVSARPRSGEPMNTRSSGSAIRRGARFSGYEFEPKLAPLVPLTACSRSCGARGRESNPMTPGATKRNRT
jgi:mannose-1-phosphate guanylyltransferase